MDNNCNSVEQVSANEYLDGLFHPVLWINGSHYLKFLHKMGKLMLNLIHAEPLCMVNKLPFLDKLI